MTTTNNPASSTATSTSASSRRQIPKWINVKNLNPLEFSIRAITSIIFVVVVWIVLVAQSFGENAAITFPRDIGMTVTVATILLSLWPIVSAVRSKNWIAIVLLVGLVVIEIFLVSNVTRWFGQLGLAQSLWDFKVLGVVAIILNAWLVFRLGSGTQKSDPEFEEHASAVKDAQVKLTAAEDRSGIVVEELRVHEENRNKLRKDLDDQKTKLSNISTDVGKWEKKLADTTEADDVATLTKEQTVIETELSEAKRAASKNKKDIALQTEVKRLEQERSDVAAQVATAQKKMDDSRESRKLISLRKDQKNITRKHDELDKDHKLSKKACENTKETLKGVTAVVDKAKEALKQAEENRDAYAASTPGDSRGWWLKTVIILLVMLVFYTSLYGMVLTERYPV